MIDYERLLHMYVPILADITDYADKKMTLHKMTGGQGDRENGELICIVI